MLEIIAGTAKKDLQLETLLRTMEEYALLYIYAKRRQKGCDGLGELNNLRDELRSALDETVSYCKDKGLLAEAVHVDMDTMIEELGERSGHPGG